ncbi:MAG: NAD-dependent epimerase/dehydratase family protein [Candidatus Micrarchaeota archaeon]
MDILIIGGSRFVGPFLVKLLVEKKHNVTLFNRGLIQSDYDQVLFIKGDRNGGFQIDQKFQVVIDMCAYDGMQTKTALTQLDFDFFIHFGTAAAYRKSNFILTEESPLGDWPLWGEYNRGKVECENVLAAGNINFASIRPVYILGPKNYSDREHFIYNKIRSSEPLILPGDGNATVQFVFANDVANCMALLAEKRAKGCFNCVGDEKITLRNLVNGMGKIVGKKPILKFNPDNDGENFDRSEFPFANENFICSNAKFKSFGVNFTPLFKGLKEDYENYYSKL